MTLDDIPVRLRKAWDDALPPASSLLPTDSKIMFRRGALTPAKRQLLTRRSKQSSASTYSNRKRIWNRAMDPANNLPADFIVRPAWTFKGFIATWTIVFVPLPGADVLAALAGQKVGPLAGDAWRVRLIHSYTRFDQVRVGAMSATEGRFLSFFRRGAPVAMLAPLWLAKGEHDGLLSHELKLRQIT